VGSEARALFICSDERSFFSFKLGAITGFSLVFVAFLRIWSQEIYWNLHATIAVGERKYPTQEI